MQGILAKHNKMCQKTQILKKSVYTELPKKGRKNKPAIVTFDRKDIWHSMGLEISRHLPLFNIRL